MSEIAKRISKVFLKEMHNKKKTTYQHLSSENGELSFKKATEVDKINTRNITSTNDAYESAFKVLTNKLKSYDNIKLTYVGGMAMYRMNGNFHSSFKKLEKDGKLILLSIII